MAEDKQAVSSAELSEINTDLVLRIQQGEKELMPELWAGVERLAAWYANRLLNKLPSGLTEFDELISAAYIALVDAVNTCDLERGNFTYYYSLRVKAAFSEVLGGRSSRQRNDPLHYALRLEEPIGGEDDDIYLADTVTDENAEAALENVEKKLYLQQLHEELDAALKSLPVLQEVILRRRYYKNETLESIGAELHTSRENVRQREKRALRALRCSSSSPRLWELAYPGRERWIDSKTNYYHHTSVSSFTRTGLSDVERLAIMREEWREMDLIHLASKRLNQDLSSYPKADYEREYAEMDDYLAVSARLEEEFLKEHPWLRVQYEKIRAERQPDDFDM